MTIQVVRENAQWVINMSRKKQGKKREGGKSPKSGGGSSGNGEGIARVQARKQGECVHVCACVLWQGSGSGGAAEQGRATFMHLL